MAREFAPGLARKAYGLDPESGSKSIRGDRQLNEKLLEVLDLSGKVAIVTGATGTLGGDRPAGSPASERRSGSSAAAKGGPWRSLRR